MLKYFPELWFLRSNIRAHSLHTYLFGAQELDIPQGYMYVGHGYINSGAMQRYWSYMGVRKPEDLEDLGMMEELETMEELLLLIILDASSPNTSDVVGDSDNGGVMGVVGVMGVAGVTESTVGHMASVFQYTYHSCNRDMVSALHPLTHPAPLPPPQVLQYTYPLHSCSRDTGSATHYRARRRTPHMPG